MAAPADLFPGFAVPAADFARRHPHLAVDDKLLASFREEPVDTLTAASLLDRAVNNTSVMFLLQVGEALLLFPGDAQWGAWRPLLDDPDVRSLLSRTTLYKISHHGSHNGTPVEVAADVFRGVTSLLSVRLIQATLREQVLSDQASNINSKYWWRVQQRVVRGHLRITHGGR